MCQATVWRRGPLGKSEATIVYTNIGISSTVSIEADMCETVGCILLSYNNRVKKKS